MTLKLSTAASAVALLALAACNNAGGGGETRDAVRAVGSSTVYPFATRIAESFTRNYDFASPIIESTGTGGGVALFCQGVGPETPDIVNASRRMKASEFETCRQNGVEEITEIQVGLDGIAFASANGGIDFDLTPEIVYEAIAANPYGEEQTNEMWSDIDPSLPNKPILVYGPPSTSGTRDALNELVLMVGCESGEGMAELEEQDEDRFETVCTELRNDGAFVEQGEQDNLIVQKIEGNADAIGIFGFSYLDANSDRVHGLTMNGVEPTYENISNFDYIGARPLFIYVKNAHLDAIPGLREFVAEWANNWGSGGPLAEVGLVPNPEAAMARSNTAASDFTALAASDLD
ncbi:substrate-binding domain-containing protein [Aurantiacibacter poecillastricola]|uniref:substrate-binding domain-containing protein n=1 Tax=Aurantiacibacter poecillastricola TaxID=3064385 RepID=UPI00273FF527|nr:substrate-binding domain-containing protein [Aurantiacibacter sp. 219JJ12-13]MDP5261905.1 substrate-binding domain-containing protein [Aurantiacibacter sp. 219JJ12-13]